MSRVIDPESAGSEINYVSSVSASPVVTRSQRGSLREGEPRRGRAEDPGTSSEGVFLEFKGSLSRGAT